MNDHSHEHHAVLDAIAAWIKKYREVVGTQNELANCTPEQVVSIARDMGLSPGELPPSARRSFGNSSAA